MQCVKSQTKIRPSYTITDIRSTFMALLIGFLTLTISPLSASANAEKTITATQPNNLHAQRALYSTAIAMIDARDWRGLRALRGQLVDYPLHSYLEYADLLANMSLPQRLKISEYLDQHEDSVLAYRLRSKWLAYLADRGQWTYYLQYYRSDEASTARRCQFHLAQYYRQQRTAAIAGGQELWTVGNSQPRQCNDLFKILMRNGKIEDGRAWERFQQALLAHNHSLARYIRQFMTEPDTLRRAEVYYQLDRRPETLANEIDSLIEKPQTAAIVGHALRHLAKRNPQRAILVWRRWQAHFALAEADRAEVVSALVKALVKVGDRQQADQYLQQHTDVINSQLEGSVIEWRIRHALKEENWPDVLRWIGALSEDRQKRSAWRYWRIRSLESIPASDVVLTRQLTRELALERDFYGFLMSEKLQQNYSFNHRPAEVDEATQRRVEALPALHRARELYHHERIVEANREWHAATKEFAQEDWMAAAIMTHRWEWHSRAIIAMAQAQFWDDIVIRFPLAYQAALQRAAESSGVASHTLYAIARQESAFERSATSSAGAIGMLQIMPATARETARQFGIPYRDKRQLRDLATNLPIGSQYYKSLLKRFDNNRILATAAYNAGPERVAKWLSRSRGEQPFDIWVELIPFKETRGYVTNVLMYSSIYSHRLGNDTPMLETSEREQLL